MTMTSDAEALRASSFPATRRPGVVARIRRAIAHAFERARTERALARLDAHLRRDIGLPERPARSPRDALGRPEPWC